MSHKPTQPKNFDFDLSRLFSERDTSFHFIAELIPQLVWVTRPDGYSEYYNQQWYSYTGTNHKETKGEGWNDFFHPDDQKRSLKLWKHCLSTGEQYEIEYRLKNGTTGEYRWFLGRAIPIRDKNSEIMKWFGTCTDIHEQKETSESLEFLVEASKLLSSSLNYREALKKVSQLAVDQVADWCSVEILKEGNLENIAIAHKQPKKVAWARKRREDSPTDLNSDTGLALVLKTGQSLFIPLISEEMLEAAAKNKEELELIKSIGFSSIIIVPIKVNNIVVGAIQLVATESQRRFTNSHLHMAEELASRASLSIYNSQLYEEAQMRELQFNALYNSNMVSMMYLDSDGYVYDANEAFLQLLGYTKEDLEQRKLNFADLSPAEFYQRTQQSISDVKNTGVSNLYEKEYVRKDGTRVPVIVGGVLLDKEKDTTLAFVLDITERKKLEQRKDEFIGVASHELKTPLTSVKGYVQILERIIQQMGDEHLQMYIKKTNTYIDRLNSLITDLLDVSKIQSGKLELNSSKFDFDELVQESIEAIQHTSIKHSIILDGKAKKSMYGDNHRLEQVFTNLLTNAIKYSPKEEKIVVAVSSNETEIIVSVRDFGIGIAKKEQSKLFERFYRVESAAKKYSGLGIGLYISWEIIQRHGGKMWVKSNEKKGSTFFFSLPLHKKRVKLH